MGLAGCLAAALGELGHAQALSLSLCRKPDIFGKHVALAVRISPRTPHVEISRIIEVSREVLLHPAHATVTPSAHILMDQMCNSGIVFSFLVEAPNAVNDCSPADGSPIDKFLEVACWNDPPQAIGRRCSNPAEP